MGLDEWLVRVSWLGKLALVFWWVELDLFSLEFSEVSSYEFRGVYGFDVTFWLPAFLCSGLCYFVVEGLAWYVLLCNLLALGWNLVSV